MKLLPFLLPDSHQPVLLESPLGFLKVRTPRSLHVRPASSSQPASFWYRNQKNPCLGRTRGSDSGADSDAEKVRATVADE
jgi:hypothetical protein